MNEQDYRIRITPEDVLRGQGAEPDKVRQRRPVLYELAEQAVSMGESLIHPRVWIQEFKVSEVRHNQILLAGGGFLSGELVVQQMGGSESVALAVATLGGALEQKVNELLANEPALALAIDSYGSQAADALGREICNQFRENAKQRGLEASSPISPGMVGWPIESGQAQIFSLLGSADLEVGLTEGSLMIPQKSITLAVGIGAEMDNSFMPCDFCGLKESCSYQFHMRAKENHGQG